MCTFVVIGETKATSCNMILDDALTAMGDKILQGIECQIWQGMNCIAHWIPESILNQLPEMYRRDYLESLSN